MGGLRGFRDPAFFRPLMGGRRIRHQNLPEGFFGKRGMASAAEGLGGDRHRRRKGNRSRLGSGATREGLKVVGDIDPAGERTASEMAEKGEQSASHPCDPLR